MSWVKIQVNDILFSGKTNSEIGIYVRYKALCEQLRLEELPHDKIKINFNPKEIKVLVKFGLTSPDLRHYLGLTSSQVSQDLVKSSLRVGQNSVNKNKEITDINNNINNNIYNKPSLDYPRLDKKSSKEDKKQKISFADVDDWESLFTFWEENKKGGKYKNHESRERMLGKLKELTENNLEYAKQAIVFCVDNAYHGFCNGNELFYKGAKPQWKTIDAKPDAFEIFNQAMDEIERRAAQ